ncbi:MAG: S41 family peptidase [Ekhidna sp.]|uniref:S41 family peptidase n=1 Tax=Ekhidna sp. TaxID=2608089 RepID=UPI0032ECAB1E
MRRFSVLAITFVLLLTSSFSPKEPIRAEEPLSKIERLYLTCKIWGFMKYYHPLISKGSFNWDDKLLTLIDNTKNIQTYEAFSDYMAKWIYYLGQIPPCRTCNQRSQYEPFQENFDLSWTQSSKFSDEFRKSLKNIENNRFQGDHYYIGQGDLGQFEPKNEPQQYDLIWKEENQRLIPLFRYWNYIEYFYPYKYQTDQDWDDVLKEMIPKFIDVSTQLDFHLAMLEMVVKADDSHAGLVTPVLDQMPYYNYLPAKFEMIEDQAVITEIIDNEKSIMADLKVGDVIKRVNGQTVRELHDSHKKYIWGSNGAVKDRSIYHTLFMGLKEAPKVTIERNGTMRTDYLTFYKYSDISYTKPAPKPKWSSPTDSIGYVNLGELSVGDVNQMMGEMMDKTVIIFDVRNNPRGTYKAIAKYLNPKDTTFAIYTKPDLSYPGKFVWNGENACGEVNEDYFKGQVILLVNELTQDHAEFTCMCLQTAPNVVVVGGQTAGTDGKDSKFPIYDRYYTSMTGMGVFYANKQETQRVGIPLDAEVERTIAGIREGRDEILEKAMELAQEEVARKIAEEMARQAAILDSLRMDSLRMVTNPLMMDSVSTDSLKVDGDWD